MKRKNQTNTTAVIYARYSPRRNKDECESCETQIDFAQNYCKFHKLAVISTHRDDGLSGSKSVNRPGLQEALLAAINYKAVLVVYSLSRLARNTRETIEITDSLQAAKANLCSVTENIDTTTAMGSAFYKIIAVLAELEREQIGERTREAMLWHQAHGRRMSKIPPYGWQDDPYDPARMVPNEYEITVIEKIKKLRAAGLSLRKIAAELIKLGYAARMVAKVVDGQDVEVAGVWHFGTVRRILNRAEMTSY